MEWCVPVNSILPDPITKLNFNLIPTSHHETTSVRLIQESLGKIIDAIGEQSAAAQGLSKVITTADKLRNAPSHVLYLLKDAKAKGGKGEVIGLLKVGCKHLFLFDEQDKVCEVEPLCVLDFYIQKDRQRHGYGKILFDYMLQDNNATATELAIDGPSPKMEQFLHKCYGIDRLLRQNNNFAVAPQFFSTVPMSKSGRSTPTVAAAVGRFAAPKPPSAIASVIHGGGAAFQGNNTNGNVSNGASPEPDAPKPVPEPEVPEPEPPVEEAVGEETKEDEPEKISPERPSTLSVEPISDSNVGAPSPAGSTLSRRDSQLTDRGYFDVKFYHNKLW